VGWFSDLFKKTVTYQYWGIATASIAPDTPKDYANDFALVSNLISDVNYFDAYEYATINDPRRLKFGQLANKFENNNFFGGFASVGIGYAVLKYTDIRLAISPNSPNDVNILNTSAEIPSFTDWVEISLTEDFAYDSTTNIFQLNGVSYTVDLTTADYTNSTVEITNTVSGQVNVFDIPAKPSGSYLAVQYTLVISGETSPIYIWIYRIGSGDFPALDMYTQISATGDDDTLKLFPPLPVRVDNSNYPNITLHDDYEEYAEALGVDPENVVSNFTSENGDMSVLDHASVNPGINIEAKDKHSLKYCFKFLHKLDILESTNVVGSVPTYTSGLVYYDLPSVPGISVSTIIPINYPGTELVCAFENFAYTLKWAGISIVSIDAATINSSTNLTTIKDDIKNQSVSDYGKKSGTLYGSILSNTLYELMDDIPWINTQEGITVAANIGETSATNRSSDYIYDNIITFIALRADGSMECATLVSPQVSYNVLDKGSGRRSTVVVRLNSEDAEIFFPLDWGTLKSMPMQAITPLTLHNMHLTIYYAYYEQRREWRSWVKFAVVIIAFYYVPITGVGGTTTTLAAQIAASEAVIAIAAALGVSTVVVTAVLILSMTGVFGEEAALLASIVFVAANIMGPNFSIGLNQATVQLITGVGDIMNQIKMIHERDQFEALQAEDANLSLAYLDELEALTDILEELGYYKRQDISKWVAINLLNIKKVDTLRVMSPQDYRLTYKNSVKPGAYFDNMYTFV
jgi:hypothetical protein